MRVAPRALADGDDVDAVLGDLDRRSQARSARSDDEDGGGDLTFIHAVHAKNLLSITPMHSSACFDTL
ncbi:hypothetical protein D3C73_1606440 [compost metagenome]